MKRFLDILGSATGLVFLLPMFGVVTLLIWFKMGRPILFIQKRPGKNGEIFNVIKFRTMLKSIPTIDGTILSDADRMISFGKFLRSTSLDETPELWNVLKGDMSLVGPRPLLVKYLPLYNVQQARRHEIRPGITGWAQVNGRNSLCWDKKFEMDVWYIENQSFILDLKILWMTFKKVITRDGISAEGEVTTKEFEG